MEISFVSSNIKQVETIPKRTTPKSRFDQIKEITTTTTFKTIQKICRLLQRPAFDDLVIGVTISVLIESWSILSVFTENGNIKSEQPVSKKRLNYQRQQLRR
jgi:hypothetical protein